MLKLIKSTLQTKTWRKNQNWYYNGKSNECEKYQKTLIKNIIGTDLYNTKIRLNLCSYEIMKINNLNKRNDYFEWSEDFDGYYKINDNKCYFNLKFVCDSGGSQTRTLRQVYFHIIAQLNYIRKYQKTDTYMVNILDGSESSKHIDKMYYRINMSDKYKKYIFIGDMVEFQKWWLDNFI